MIYTALIQQAITLAVKTHESGSKQKRKGSDVPYIIHPLIVAMILARVTQDENVIAAGLLHDTIEDCKPYGTVTKELIAKEFNADVARIVNDVTEQDLTLTWIERKLAAMAHIKDMQQDSLLVKSADVLHNLSEINDTVAADEATAFTKFNASKEDTITRFKTIIPELAKAWPQNPLLGDLEAALSVFTDLVKGESPALSSSL